MAKVKKVGSTAGKLAGKTIAFVGKFGYKNMSLPMYTEMVVKEGGTVVDAAQAVPEVLFVGEGRGGKPPSEVAKIQKKSPAIQVYDLAGMMQFLLPDRDGLIQEIAKGRRDDGHRFWDSLEAMCRAAGTMVDLTGVDLRTADLYGAKLEGVQLDGADLRGVQAEYTHFGDLEGVNFDGCNAKNVYLQSLKECKFRQANLEKAWLFFGNAKKAERCDFKGANMREAHGYPGTFIDCSFRDVDLSDAKIEHSVFQGADFTNANLSRVHASMAKFEGAIFAKANLQRADLRKASLLRADLRNANLREAVLTDVDLTGANVEGADFQDAVLTGANIAGLDVSKAKHFQQQVVRVAGPKVLEFAAVAAASKSFTTSAEVDLSKGEFATLVISHGGSHSHARSAYHRDGQQVVDLILSPTFEQGMLNLADRWPNAILRLDSIKVKGSRTLRGQKLQDLAMGAWAEVFGIADTSPQTLLKQKDDQVAKVEKLRATMLAELRGGKAGIEKWNARSDRERAQIDPLHDLALKGAKLNEVNLGNRDLKGSSLEKASIKKANLCSTNLEGANLTDATLSESRLLFAKCSDASFVGANLEKCDCFLIDLQKADLTNANLTGGSLRASYLQGTDFTGAQLDGADFENANYDSATKFPTGFVPTPSMKYIQLASSIAPVGPPPQTGTLDFETFIQKLNNKVDMARMQKAGAMLKAERFQIFAEVKDNSIVGIVKSQSSHDLVYSCMLASDGAFSCCTQNLRPCGGLRGALCKHLLVLIVGLAKAGQLDSATVDHWIDLSRRKKPAIDEDAMSATFLRYKGAEAGEVDWRPTETIPEDFYAM